MTDAELEAWRNEEAGAAFVPKTEPEALLINEVQLLLAEKRTSLSVMRTGITVLVLPLSVLSVLIATSRYYEVLTVIHLIVPLFTLCTGLVVLGIYLIHRSMRRIWRYDHGIQELKKRHGRLAEFID
jgi:membrane protein YdbS with pleckstrin-like domain